MLSETPALVDAVLQRFNALWEGEPCATCGRRDVCPVPLEEPRLTPHTRGSSSVS